jgi:DNA-binding IclR family transcriptional regulator
MSGTPQQSQVRFPVDPRDVPPTKAARRLHLTLAEFEQLLPRLFRRGFPRPDPDTGNYDLKAVDQWMDSRSSLPLANPLRDARSEISEHLAQLRQRRGRNSSN